MLTTILRSEIRRVIMSGGLPNEYRATALACGHWCGADLPAGAAFDCEACDRDSASRAKVAEAHAAGLIAHTRAGGQLMRGSILIYGRDADSPTGVRFLTGLDDTEANYHFLRSLSPSYSPLSPTEGRGR